MRGTDRRSSPPPRPEAISPAELGAGSGYSLAPSRASYSLERLRADILSIRLRPGQKLTFDMLTQTYQVGLSPLREALCQLVGHGLVTLESQRGFRVAPVSRADLRDVIACRRWVEPHAIELSSAQGDDRWRAEVKTALAGFEQVAAKAGDQRPINAGWQDIHRRLHFALINACGSATLLHFCSQIYDRFDRYRRIAVLEQGLMAATALDHREIARAALAGEALKASALLEAHIDDIAEVVVTRFDAMAGDYETADAATTATGKRGR
jgi:GntR family carbon starvation induced transcriptional regulator